MSISRNRLKEIREIRDTEIDTSDIPELDDRFWEKAKLVMPEKKDSISLRIDKDVLEWFKSLGQGYQTRMNAVLRSFMNAQMNKEK